MAPRRRIPVLLLTGFLGSGKTTLLRSWLLDAAFARTIVLVNEIGEVGVDQQLLAPLAGDPVLLENGCICCDAGGDLVAALEQLFFDRLHRKIAFDRVVVETTGLAAPTLVLQALQQSEILRDRYQPPFVLATFDAVRGPGQLARHPEVRDQIGAAHAIVLTRTDVAGDGEIGASISVVAQVRPGVAVLRSGRERIPAQTVAALIETAPHAPMSSLDSVAHSSDVTTAFAPMPGPVTEQALLLALQSMVRDGGEAVLRVKGFVEIAGAGLRSVQADASGISLEPVVAEDARPGLTIICQNRPASELAVSLGAKLSFRGLRSP